MIDSGLGGGGRSRASAVSDTALCAAWQVAIIDPEWGRNDVLWPVLESFAAHHQA